MKASDLLVRCLEAEGVRHVFGVPGEENLDILESLRDSPIHLVVTRHEQTAGFMAATCGRLTGVPGVCLSTLGPGATNLMTASAYAHCGRDADGYARRAKTGPIFEAESLPNHRRSGHDGADHQVHEAGSECRIYPGQGA